MTASLTRATIISDLGSHPEVRSMFSGTKVATVSVATRRSCTCPDHRLRGGRCKHMLAALLAEEGGRDSRAR